MSGLYGNCGVCGVPMPPPTAAAHQCLGISFATRTPPKVAQLCPVCNGRGIVPPAFYDPSRWTGAYQPSQTAIPTPVTCRGCGGTGVVFA